ncbi:MAG: alpha-amylase family protein, partial [Actinomycetota bacterium]
MEGYLGTYRRMLLDMHITDADPSFMTKYDPIALARLYERANVGGVMLYTNSHVGLTYYPASEGRMHPGIGGRDVVGELVDALHKRDIKACAYYSVLFDNWAVTEHPEWWTSPLRDPDASSTGGSGGSRSIPRYGVVCPSNEDYVKLTLARITELLDRYDFDCLFYDMTFWAAVCGCARCRDRYGADLPTRIDWTDPAWCRFQAAREDWMRSFVERIVDAAKLVAPGLRVYNNFALAVANWGPGFALDLAELVDFCGGDMYGDRDEQLVVSKLMMNLTKNRPAEFMTSLCVNLRDHVGLRTADDLAMKAFAATAHGSATLFIDAIDPDGGVDAPRYEMVREVFDRVASYEHLLGGEPVEDIAVYHSSESRMSFEENGRPVDRPGRGTPAHQRALRGACRYLQRAHLPFGVITRRQLDELDRYRVIVLPNVTRLDGDEVHAFREFVRRGGRLYASAWTSLLEVAGKLHYDFLLADVFGAVSDGVEAGSALYAKPVDDETAASLSPQRYLSVMPRMRGMEVVGHVRAPSTRATTGRPLATLTYPYGHPHPGSAIDRHWSSIHSWPPHLDTDRAVLVENVFGAGRCVYSA